MVIHHTDCGALRFTEEGMREKVVARMGFENADEINQMSLGALEEYESLRLSFCERSLSTYTKLASNKALRTT